MECADFAGALDLLCGLGMRLDVIYPADDPHSATLSHGADCVRLTSRPDAPAPSEALPPFAPEFVLTRAAADGALGRAGMHYRDLIPGRLGGRYIASHISIAEGGPVSDWVHYHHVALQIIYVVRGWVRVVYEDQGDPFVMNPGDLVLQPRGIRHRVIESGDSLEVVEISCPALHETFADHALALPNVKPTARSFGRQGFLRHVAEDTAWVPFNGAEAQSTKIDEASGGIAEVRTIRAGAASDIRFEPHEGELVFGFVLDGSASLNCRGPAELGPGDAFVIPPSEAWWLDHLGDDFRLLHMTAAELPEDFA